MSLLGLARPVDRRTSVYLFEVRQVPGVHFLELLDCSLIYLVKIMCRLKIYDVIILLSTIKEDHLQA